MNYEELKRNIADVVKPNGNQEITGQIMQDALFALIENLGEGWQFGGAVRPSDAPVLGADVRAFYLAVEKGVYADFGGVEVTELSAIVYGDGWGVLPLGVAFGVDTEAEIGALSERVRALEADGSVTTSRIADKAVTTEKIANEAITEEKLGAKAVTISRIADGAVTTPKIADGAVTSDKIADYAVIGKKIASGAITNDKIMAGAVSADKLNTDLLSMINSLGAGYQFIGVATPTTNPENPDAKVFYIANGKGTYTNFGGIEVTEDEVVVLYYDTEWHKVATGIASQAKLSELEQDISDKVDKNGAGITVISDDSDTFYIVDSSGYIIAKIDATGIHSPNINEMLSTINDISGNLLSLSGDVSSLANRVASIFDADVENIFADNSSELLVVDEKGYIGLRVSNRGVEGVFLNTTAGGIKNDLRRQNNILPIIGNYGGENAVYKISGLPKTFRVVFDFRLNENINIAGIDKPFVRLVGSNIKDVKPIHATPTDLPVSRNGEIYSAVSQVIGFNSGFNVCGTSFVRSPTTKKPIVGDTAFSLWLKGNFNEESDFPTKQKVLERASWLSSHSTAKIVFANDTFSVQGISESDINISIKVGDTYKSLGVFYDELVSALGNYFVFKKQRLSASKTTADLLQFGELKLVANYWQQTDKASTSLSYNYDSFPVSIPLAIDETLHTVEIIGADGNVWVSVDGQFTKYSDTLTDIYIGGTETESGLVSCYNLEYEKGSLGDAIINDTYGIVSSRTPRVVGVMQHLIEDKYEGETLTQPYYASVSRMLDIFRMLENRGYTILTLNDVCLWLSGRKHIPARSIFFLASTNPTYDNFLNDLLSRRIWTSASVPLIIGSIIKTDVASAGGADALFKNVISARAIGVDYIAHLYDHDVLPDYKNSIILQQELFKLIRLCISCGIDTRMYSYGWSCESVNYFNMLSLNGFIGAIDSSGEPSINADIQYKISRKNIDDAMALNTLSNILI